MEKTNFVTRGKVFSVIALLCVLDSSAFAQGKSPGQNSKVEINKDNNILYQQGGRVKDSTLNNNPPMDSTLNKNPLGDSTLNKNPPADSTLNKNPPADPTLNKNPPAVAPTGSNVPAVIDKNLNTGGVDKENNPNLKSGGKRQENDDNLTDGGQTNQLDDIPDPTHFNKPCEDAALKQIYANILADKDSSKILGWMFELTAARLAKRAAEQGAESVEKMVKGEIDQIEQNIGSMKDETTQKVKDQVQNIYKAYGMASDADVIEKDLDAALAKGKTACYWCRGQRLANKHASAYILSLALGEQSSNNPADTATLTDADAATVWVVEKLRANADQKKYGVGTEKGNLLSVTVRAARYLSQIEGGLAADPTRIQGKIDDMQKQLDDVFTRNSGITSDIETTLKNCIDKRNTQANGGKTCPDCNATDFANFKKEVSNISVLQKGLLEVVAKSDSIKIEKGLKAKMGSLTFDLSNYAKDANSSDPKKAEVTPWNKDRDGKVIRRSHGVDNCGHQIINGVKQHQNNQ